MKSKSFQKIFIATMPVSIILSVGCTTYHFQEAPAPTVVPTAKVALLGFYPFDAKATGSSTTGNTVTTYYEANLRYKDTYKRALGFGSPVADIPVTGRRQISKDEFERIAKQYISQVKRSGIAEIQKIFDLPGTRDNQTQNFYLKTRDVDYYIFGIHLPAFPECNKDKGGREALNFFGSLFTFTTIPWFKDCKVSSEFLLYDRNFQLLKSFKYDTDFQSRTAWWNVFTGTPYNILNQAGEPPEIIIENDARRLAADLRGIIP